MEIDKTVFSKKLRELMEDRHVSKYKLANTLGCSQSSVANWLKGATKPANGYVYAIVDYFGVNLWELIGSKPSESSKNQSRMDASTNISRLSDSDFLVRYKKLPSSTQFHIDNLVDLSAQHPDRAPVILEDAVLAFGDSNWTAENEKSPGLSTEAWKIASDYEDMDRWGQKAVRSLTDTELARVRDEDDRMDNVVQMRPAVKDVPLLGTSFAAGPGEIDTGNAWTTYTIPESSPADFAIRVNGDSMEPWLPDGSIALCKRENPRDGDVAALLLDGDFLCKQVCQDITGTLHLFSLNRARKNMDRHISRDDIDRQLVCFGTVLLDTVPALPID